MSVYKKMAQVQKEISEAGIEKAQTNSHQRFKFRGIDDVMNALSPILSRNALLILPSLQELNVKQVTTTTGKITNHATVKVKYVFVDGETGDKAEDAPIYPGEATDTADKAIGKAMSYAYKVACLQTFCIPLEAQEDPDKVTVEINFMLERIKALMLETNTDESTFITALKFKAKNISDLSKDECLTAIKQLERKQAKLKSINSEAA